MPSHTRGCLRPALSGTPSDGMGPSASGPVGPLWIGPHLLTGPLRLRHNPQPNPPRVLPKPSRVLQPRRVSPPEGEQGSLVQTRVRLAGAVSPHWVPTLFLGPWFPAPASLPSRTFFLSRPPASLPLPPTTGTQQLIEGSTPSNYHLFGQQSPSMLRHPLPRCP